MAKKRISKAIKEQVRNRANGICEYCLSQEKFASQSFSIDHVLPEIEGGKGILENLSLACQGCNNFKYTKTNAKDFNSGKMVRLFNPRNDKWLDHFKWNENFTVIIAVSPIGRVTIDALNLNRESLLNQRSLYRAFGIHPPDII
ncbi:MAG: HNH endonuclease [Saprospiraceae bacterium]